MTINETFIKENKDKRFTITFETGLVLKNIKLFIAENGVIAYLSGRQKRRGYGFPLYTKITDIVEMKKRPEPTNISNAKTILKKIHPNVWVNLQKEMKDVIENNIINQDFDWHFTGKLKFKNINQYLNRYDQKRLKDAFENKTDFKWHKNTYHHAGRDLSISCEIGSDGEFRAFFSSEYMGCGNGDYWLLLNPTTAIFYETD